MAAFDLDPNKLDALTFGARTYHRLRVKVADNLGLHSSTLVPQPDKEDVRALMEFVQEESFEEDLFNEVGPLRSDIGCRSYLLVQLRSEALRGDSTVEARKISTFIGEEELVFELVCPPLLL